MSELTVADELAYDELPEETRALCEKIIAARTEEADDVYQSGYDAGYKARRAGDAESDAIAAAYQNGYNDGQSAERRKAEAPKPAATLDASHLASQLAELKKEFPTGEAAD